MFENTRADVNYYQLCRNKGSLALHDISGIISGLSMHYPMHRFTWCSCFPSDLWTFSAWKADQPTGCHMLKEQLLVLSLTPCAIPEWMQIPARHLQQHSGFSGCTLNFIKPWVFPIYHGSCWCEQPSSCDLNPGLGNQMLYISNQTLWSVMSRCALCTLKTTCRNTLSQLQKTLATQKQHTLAPGWWH